MTEIHWLDDDYGSSPRLHCAHCGSECVHHARVTVFNREREDATRGLRAVIEHQHCQRFADQRGNPSDRRDGIIVELWCEQCSGASELRLAQHKGVTFLELLRIESRPARVRRRFDPANPPF